MSRQPGLVKIGKRSTNLLAVSEPGSPPINILKQPKYILSHDKSGNSKAKMVVILDRKLNGITRKQINKRNDSSYSNWHVCAMRQFETQSQQTLIYFYKCMKK
jgi:hypothetical protein